MQSLDSSEPLHIIPRGLEEPDQYDNLAKLNQMGHQSTRTKEVESIDLIRQRILALKERFL